MVLDPNAASELEYLLEVDQATADGHQHALTRKAVKPSAASRHYPPDALNASWRKVNRTLLSAPASFISLLDTIGGQRQHTLYFAEVDHTIGQCYDPELAQGVHRTFRTALKINSRRGHPAWVAIETGRGQHPLHIHVMSRSDAPLPDSFDVYSPAGQLIASFRKEPGRTIMNSSGRLGRYLRKVSHYGAKEFDRSYPADDPRQPAPFREAFAAWKAGRQRCEDLGLERAPRRTFGLYIPRLTPAKIQAALDILLKTGRRTKVKSVRKAEWNRKNIENRMASNDSKRKELKLIKWDTEESWERLRLSINVLIRAFQDGGNLSKAHRSCKKSNHQTPPYQTVYNVLRRLSWAAVEGVIKAVQTLRRERDVRQSRIYRAFLKLQARKK